MPMIGFTRVQEAWCRVPKSPRESREVTGGDVPETCWQEEKFNVALASQSALDWGDSLLSVAGRCLDL